MTPQRWFSAVFISSLLVLAGGVHGVTSAPSAAAEATSSSPSFRVATLNIRHGLSDADAVSDVVKLSNAGADLVGLQEMGSAQRRNAVRARVVDCATCPYDTYMPTGSGPAEIPILFRSDKFTLLSKDTRKVSDRTYVGPDGAGPSWIAPKYLTYVQLRHKLTGQVLYLINNHTVASVQASDGGPNWDNRERLELYRKHMNALKALITEFKATGAAVLTTGDFNVNYRSDSVIRHELFPYRNMEQVRVFTSFKYLGTPERGTHVNKNGNSSRIIDYVSAVEHPALAARDQAVLLGYNSDHRPVLVRYAVTAAPAAPTTVVAEPLERAARVSWASAVDNGQPVTSYAVTNVQTGRVVTVGGDATSATVPDLATNASYTFVVSATNRIGTGPESAESDPVTPFAVPPETRITSGPGDGRYLTRNTATLGYTSDVPGSAFQCTLDGVDTACGASSVRLTSLAQTTHTFGVTARDAAGDADPSPATRSWTVPLDSSVLGRSASWSARTGSAYYTGRYVESTTRGAVVRRGVSGARGLALVATKGPGHGAVAVYLGTTLLKEISLEADSLHMRRVLKIARFSAPQTGRVRIVVTSSRKPVRVEGIGVATR